MSDNISYVTKIPEIKVRLVIEDGSKEENIRSAEQSIREALKILNFKIDPKIYINFFNLLYDEWDDVIMAIDSIHDRIRFDYYLMRLESKKRKSGRSFNVPIL
jgi:hypothetical protein